MLRRYYKLKTYSKPLHLILTSNFPYIPYINGKRCWNCTNERKSQKFACDSTKESTKGGLICSVREEPNSVQPCQFRFLTNHCQARAANPRKQPEKLGWESGVFSGALKNAFRDPRNSPEKSPEKSSGPRSFRLFWETHARTDFLNEVEGVNVGGGGGEGGGGALGNTHDRHKYRTLFSKWMVN